MGWDFYCDPYWNKARVVAEMIKDNSHYKVLDHAVVGNELWRLVEIKVDELAGQRRIFRDLLKGGGKGSGWGHKDVPYHEGVGCPQRMVDAIVVRDERFDLWACVNAEERYGKAARSKWLKSLLPGEKVVVYGKPYVLEVKGRGFWIGRDEDGRKWRLRASVIRRS